MVWTDIFYGSAAAAGTIIVFPLFVSAGLSALGFTSTGIVAGSFAAGAQASVGNVAASSWIAYFLGDDGDFYHSQCYGWCSSRMVCDVSKEIRYIVIYFVLCLIPIVIKFLFAATTNKITSPSEIKIAESYLHND